MCRETGTKRDGCHDIHIYEKPPLRIDTLGAAATVLTHNVLDCLREFKGEGNENNTLFGMGYV